MMTIKLVFFGTPMFSVPCLAELLACPDVEVLAVVTQPDKPSGRGQKLQPTAVKAYVQEHAPGIPVWQPKSIRKDAALIETLRGLNADCFVTIAFGQILSQEVLDVPKHGTVNVHASLLPELRGANPIQWAILQNKTVTGLTTMLTDIGVDTGAMLLKTEVPIGPDDSTLDVAQALGAAAGPLLVETLKQHVAGTLQPTPQQHDASTHAPKLTPEAALLDWTQDAQTLHNQVRGQQPWPGAYTYFQGERLKISATSIGPVISEEFINDGPPGTILAIMKEGLQVRTGAAGSLLLRRVQPAGKKEMAARDWANGILKQQPWPQLTSNPEAVSTVS